MYFKSLELVGFKSFAERTVIGFEPGITAIVGPNGCGKSNVSDAIRWVLGEQSARTLRGSLMEDLIFGGSAQLEPMGMAEVSLTLGGAARLTDGESDEVRVSRRLFRSGESQYFLNKRACRLRDIQKLFMDTGLGMQSYSYMQQGNIELILSSKPEDRRFLFDETAGITKYKAYKKESLRKLQSTEDNLLRLGDLLREVKRQMISIQRQAGKARRYKEVADELQRLEVGFLLHQRGTFSEKLESLEEKRDGIQGVLSRLSQDVEQRESRVREIRAELQSSELRYEELQSRKLDLLRNIDRESGNISLNEQRIADTRSLSENVSAEIKGMRQKVATLESALGKRNESLETLAQQRSSCDERLKRKDEEVNRTVEELRKAEAASSELSQRLLDCIRREAETRSRLSSIAERLDQNARSVVALEQRKQETLRSLEEKEQVRKDAATDEETLSLRLRREREEVAELQATIKKTEEDTRALRGEILDAESKILRVVSERRFLADALERYEGYDARVRSVIERSKKNGSRLRGIIGTVADVIEVRPGHEECVESALESRLQYVLTETVEDAKGAAAYLREKPCGRATFLPLDAVEGFNGAGQAARQLRGKEGTPLTPVLDLISFEPRYARLMEYLLGDTVLVENLDEALSLAPQCKDVTFVSRSGEKLVRAVAITAGKRATAMPGLVSRKSRVASLAGKEKEERERLNELTRRESELLAARKGLDEKLEQRTALVSSMQEGVSEAQRNLLSLSAVSESLGHRVDELDTRLAESESERKTLEDQRKSLSRELNATSKQRSEVEAALSLVGSTVEKIEKDVSALKKEAAEIALAKGSYDERIGNLQNDMEYMRGQLDLTRKEMENRARQVEQGKTYIKELQNEVQECHAAIASLSREKQEVIAAIERFDETRKLLVDELSQVEWEIKQKSNAARERDKEIADLNVKLTEIRFSINSIDDRLLSEYAGTPNDPNAELLPEDSNWEEVQSAIAQLKRRVQSMGPVNLYAIEEHDALKKRYEFLTSQQSDLVEAKDSLLKAIVKLDRESKTLFRESFERVREEFQQMFKRLFGGGRADLILVDESDVLESGIEIIARPPGKKLQAISLLSGGERAMTAISLLFAIFKVKPSPFCVLDEIDAPLDDSNIVRFGEVLREFTKNSQFIIITHNKRTISASDVLYGITMEDSGKSKVVSARLTRGKEEASAHKAEASSEFSELETASVEA